MDLRVYVDGVARIICDLTRTTTVHDIIIALAQYKGQAGRYSLVQRAPDGTQRTLSPNELTCELIHRPDWAYILQQNPAIQKRSTSLDGRKTPLQQPVVDNFSPANKKFSSVTKRANICHASPIAARRLIHKPVPLPKDNPCGPRSTIPTSLTDNSAFRILHHPYQQEYQNLLQLLNKQKLQLNQQEKDLNDKQEEINYRENILHQSKLYQEKLQHDLKIFEERDRQLFLDCQRFAQEYTSEKFDQEIQYHRNIQKDFDVLQEQLTRCSTAFEQKKQLQEQLQFNIDQIHEEIQQLQMDIDHDKQEIIQCKFNLERTNSNLKQQENFGSVLIQRNEDVEKLIQQQQKEILQLELELMNLDDEFINDSSYDFSSTSKTLLPTPLQLINSTLIKLCPSGIWV